MSAQVCVRAAALVSQEALCLAAVVAVATAGDYKHENMLLLNYVWHLNIGLFFVCVCA